MTRLIMHCFSEDIEFASDLMAFSPDIYFSFSGTVTYKNAPRIQEAASKIPLNRILIETDSPFLAPIPVRGTVNEPANVRYISGKICELRSESREEIEMALYDNALRIYGIQKSL
jgi:TatD DNase family protein